ncbi:MAG: D-alanyl-D-alanine carboxypeptidase [Ruminococcus sp.]|nr:D-alanyl-D-alanine carboxypeptidase [Ruminococcus sp.]
MSTSVKKKKYKKSRVRLDRIFLCIFILAIVLGLTIYVLHYKNTTSIHINVSDTFKNIRATMFCDDIQETPKEDTSISLDFQENLLTNVQPDDLSAQYVYALDSSNGQILFDKNSTSKCYPASTTKILTSIVAIESINLDTTFTVGNEINLAEEGSSLAYLVQGEEISLKDLLYGLMLPSGNDAAYTIAVNVARILTGNPILTDNEAVTYFVNLMNEKAQEIGMVNSHFEVPDGYHNKNHYVTAQDMMRLLIYAQRVDILKQVASTQSYSTTALTGQEHTWINTNKLLDQNSSYYYEGVNGFKTGFHDDAGNCLIVTANINSREVFLIIMKSETDDTRYQDATTLLDSIYNY